VFITLVQQGPGTVTDVKYLTKKKSLLPVKFKNLPVSNLRCQLFLVWYQKRTQICFCTKVQILSTIVIIVVQKLVNCNSTSSAVVPSDRVRTDAKYAVLSFLVRPLETVSNSCL
jgi:hypothetical protein